MAIPFVPPLPGIPSLLVCRDWTATLRRASFRGVGFFVENDSIEVGRRLVVHEFPGSDQPFIEDLGAKAQHIHVTAYVTGEILGEIELKEGALREVCTLAGAGQLVVPLGTFRAHCESCRRDYTKDKLGHIAFGLKFVRAGSDSVPFPLLGLARAIEFAAHAISIATALARTFHTLGQASYVSAAAVVGLQDFLAAFDLEARKRPVEPTIMAGALQTTSDAYVNADALCAIGTPGDRYTRTRYIGNDAESSAEPLASTIAGLFEQMLNGLNAEDAASLCAAFAEWGIAAARLTTPSMQLIAANTTAFNNLVRAVAMANYAAAITQREFTDVREARQARADAAELFEAALAGLDGWEMFDVWSELNTLRGQVAEHLTRLITTLAPVRIITAPARMPSLYWANRLYGDHRRATELVDRNGIKHALFMPTEFEALSR